MVNHVYNITIVPSTNSIQKASKDSYKKEHISSYIAIVVRVHNITRDSELNSPGSNVFNTFTLHNSPLFPCQYMKFDKFTHLRSLGNGYTFQNFHLGKSVFLLTEKTPVSLADGSFKFQAHQLVHFSAKFVRKFIEHIPAKPGNHCCHGLFVVDSSLLEVE